MPPLSVLLFFFWYVPKVKENGIIYEFAQDSCRNPVMNISYQQGALMLWDKRACMFPIDEVRIFSMIYCKETY